MSKVFSNAILGLIALVSFVSAAASFTAPTNYQLLGPADVIWTWEVATEASPRYMNGYNPGTALDKMTGADTIALLTKFPLDKGSYYAFQLVDSAGTADSFVVEFSVWSADGYQSAWVRADTIAGLNAVNKFTTLTIPTTIAYKPAKVSVRAVKWIATLVSKVRSIEVVKFPIVKP